MHRFLIISILLYLLIGQSSKALAQNIVFNGDFEECACEKEQSQFDYQYNLENQTTHWKYLAGMPCYMNKKTYLQSSSGKFTLISYITNPFRNQGHVGWFHSYNLLLDSNQFSLKYRTNSSGIQEDQWKNRRGMGIYQLLKHSLIKDSTYIISYRFSQGLPYTIHSQVYLDSMSSPMTSLNILTGYGVHFSMDPIDPNSTSPFSAAKPELQDTVLDITNRYRLVKREYKADSAYRYISLNRFASILDSRYKLNSITYDYDSMGVLFPSYAWFASLIDDVRLLPKWQYLDITSDSTICSGQNLKLEVKSGAGPYTWSRMDSTYVYLGTGSSIIVSPLRSCKYIVASPYDTAWMEVTVIPRLDSSSKDTIVKTICNGTPVMLNDPLITRWEDNTQSKIKVFSSPSSTWYITDIKACSTLRHIVQILSENIHVVLPDTPISIYCADTAVIEPIISTNTTIFYKWNDQTTNKDKIVTSNGNYTIEAYSKNCKHSDSVTIIFTSSPSRPDTISKFSCSKYIWNNTLYRTSGMYTQILKNHLGCDSTVSINLSLGIDSRIKLEDGIRYSAIQENVSYQWYSCYPWRRIANEKLQTFTTTTKGSYAVVLEDERGCIDTSDCIALYSTGISIFHLEDIQVFPNPFNNTIHVTFPRTVNLDRLSIQIEDIVGRKILSREVNSTTLEVELNLQYLIDGIYILRLKSKNINISYKIVKSQ